MGLSLPLAWHRHRHARLPQHRGYGQPVGRHLAGQGMLPGAAYRPAIRRADVPDCLRQDIYARSDLRSSGGGVAAKIAYAMAGINALTLGAPF